MRHEPPGIRSFHEFHEASPKLPQATPAHDGAASTRTHDGAHSPWGRHAHDGATLPSLTADVRPSDAPTTAARHFMATFPSLTADTPTTARVVPRGRAVLLVRTCLLAQPAPWRLARQKTERKGEHSMSGTWCRNEMAETGSSETCERPETGTKTDRGGAGSRAPGAARCQNAKSKI